MYVRIAYEATLGRYVGMLSLVGGLINAYWMVPGVDSWQNKATGGE